MKAPENLSMNELNEMGAGGKVIYIHEHSTIDTQSYLFLFLAVAQCHCCQQTNWQKESPAWSIAIKSHNSAVK